MTSAFYKWLNQYSFFIFCYCNIFWHHPGQESRNTIRRWRQPLEWNTFTCHTNIFLSFPREFQFIRLWTQISGRNTTHFHTGNKTHQSSIRTTHKKWVCYEGTIMSWKRAGRCGNQVEGGCLRVWLELKQEISVHTLSQTCLPLPCCSSGNRNHTVAAMCRYLQSVNSKTFHMIKNAVN